MNILPLSYEYRTHYPSARKEGLFSLASDAR